MEYIDRIWAVKMELAEIDQDESEEQNLVQYVDALMKKLELQREKTRDKRAKAADASCPCGTIALV
jgi:hypothetical protein